MTPFTRAAHRVVGPARGRPATALAGAAAVLVAVQIAAAQSPIRNSEAVGPVPMKHVLHPGGAPAENDGATRSPSTVGDGVSSGATLPPSAGLTITPTFDTTITSDPNAAAIENMGSRRARPPGVRARARTGPGPRRPSGPRAGAIAPA